MTNTVTVVEMTNTVTVVEGDTTVVTVTTAGPQGATGAGVASGGTTGQALVKTSNTDFATGWTDISSTAEFAALAARVAALEDLDIMLLEG